ncbi:hypothetical protein [Paraburkholderia tropica]|uniref:hypothetical protein n=1 Tax=Paraburkholderia tropica TaxID=92647 RepID=UPI002AB646C3|nr:hypothetical protein [Paraburkholderia tropica]
MKRYKFVRRCAAWATPIRHHGYSSDKFEALSELRIRFEMSRNTHQLRAISNAQGKPSIPIAFFQDHN